MDVSSLPAFPPPRTSRAETALRVSRGLLPPAQLRFLVNLLLAVALVALLIWGRMATAEIERSRENVQTQTVKVPAHIDFKVVQQQFQQVSVMMPADEVFRLLGPQRYTNLREPKLDAYEERVWARPDRYPEPRFWAKWENPDNPKRWVAVFICGRHVYKKIEWSEPDPSR